MKYQGKPIEDGRGPYRWRPIRRSVGSGFMLVDHRDADDLTNEEIEKLITDAAAANYEIRPTA